MTEVFGYALPDQCRNCEKLNLTTLNLSDNRDSLAPDTPVVAGDHLFTAESLCHSFDGLLGMVAMLCRAQKTPTPTSC